MQITRILKYNDQFIDIMSYYITVEVKDLADNSAHTFQTLVTYSSCWNDEDLRVFVEICRIKPEIPGNYYRRQMALILCLSMFKFLEFHG